MLYNQDIAHRLAELLLQIKALQVNVGHPFTWASGLKSPLYCDNRLTLSYPAIRKQIRFWLCDLVNERFPKVEQIAAVATGAIAHGMAVADQLDLPFLYVRPEPKGHGLGKQIEGRLREVPTVVIEDLISTGKSSLAAVRAIREAGAEVVGLAALFGYEFQSAEKAFRDAGCPHLVLCSFSVLREHLLASGSLNSAEADALEHWRKDPQAWSEALV